MKVFYTDELVKALGRLPRDIQNLYLAQEMLLKSNWRHSKLHIKKLRGKPIIFSFRITRSYRALFYFRASDEIVVFVIGNRKEIYKKANL